jgi:hypothetical protein
MSLLLIHARKENRLDFEGGLVYVMIFDSDGGIWRLPQPLLDGRVFSLRDSHDWRNWEGRPKDTALDQVKKLVEVQLQ